MIGNTQWEVVLPPCSVPSPIQVLESIGRRTLQQAHAHTHSRCQVRLKHKLVPDVWTPPVGHRACFSPPVSPTSYGSSAELAPSAYSRLAHDRGGARGEHPCRRLALGAWKGASSGGLSRIRSPGSAPIVWNITCRFNTLSMYTCSRLPSEGVSDRLCSKHS